MRLWIPLAEADLMGRGLFLATVGLGAFAIVHGASKEKEAPDPAGQLPLPKALVQALLALLALGIWNALADYDFTERLLNGLAILLTVWFAFALAARLRGKIKREHWFHDWSWSGFSAVWLALIIRATLVEAYSIPSESMVPTLLISDHLFVAKTPFGWHLPFTQGRFLKYRDVKRGEIVIFVPPSAPKQSYVKRCVGLPGDTVQVKDKQVYIDGQLAEVPYSYGRLTGEGLPAGVRETLLAARQSYLDARLPKLQAMEKSGPSGQRRAQQEAQATTWVGPLKTPDGTYYLEAAAVFQRPYGRLADLPKVGKFELWPKEASSPQGMLDWSRDHHLGNRDNFGPYKLQPGEYWMMGDNRDNSSDSRYFGPVPAENLRGTPLVRYWPLSRAGFLH